MDGTGDNVPRTDVFGDLGDDGVADDDDGDGSNSHFKRIPRLIHSRYGRLCSDDLNTDYIRHIFT